MGLLKVGDEAPDLSGTDQNGEKVSLAELRGHSSAVVFFYPKDGSPVCTAEVCAFRDSYERFSEIGAVVIGISGDTKDSHKQFAETHSLPFHLLSDTDGKLRKQFGVARVLGLLPGRETYVIDKEGIVRLAFSAQFASDQHVKQAVEALDTD